MSRERIKWNITLVTIAANSISSHEKLALVEAGFSFNEFTTLFPRNGRVLQMVHVTGLPTAPCHYKDCSECCASPDDEDYFVTERDWISCKDIFANE